LADGGGAGWLGSASSPERRRCPLQSQARVRRQAAGRRRHRD